jgi:hypothetical protein
VIDTLKKARSLLPAFFARLSIRRDSGPIDSIDALCRFVSTRAAFVAQKTLYGYLKTRMGSRYPRMFEDDAIIASINIAKLYIFAACLSDLTLFAVSGALRDAAPDDAGRRALALRCFRAALADNDEQVRSVPAFSAAEAVAAFESRLAAWDWQATPGNAVLFAESPAALFRWAPIAPDLKVLDREIVENSIKFTWRDVRSRFEQRLDGAAVAAEAGGRNLRTV